MPRADLDKVYAEIEQRRLKAERALERATKDAGAAQSPLQAVEARQAAERVVATASIADAGQLAEFDREWRSRGKSVPPPTSAFSATRTPGRNRG